ncbi:hypothetical protein MKK75_06625 [Methylobacterium sp. J-030]|uniref:hypothetical protein n=1 Tax=Methylobacterium sp. J-030 TaxID=2836627 RepID=UPI001FBA9D77|nr:hypothetical protein [Methylobacterium sp. J-030]MCJ2068483.1 hypothetical protein [Methylobacterium sp. J-030]
MSSGMSGGNGQLSLQDFMRLYQPTSMPVVQPQAGGLAALGQGQPAQQQQPAQRSMGFGQSQQGQGQGQQGGALPFLGQGSQSGGGTGGGYGQGQSGQGAQAAPGGLQQLLINAMNNNGANGNSNALANAVGYVPFGGGGWGSG